MSNLTIYAIDTETTGLDSKSDEILQLSIVDENGRETFDDYFCPSFHLSWESAEKVNHISLEMLSGKATIKERLEEINALFAKCDVIVGYNTGFDLAFLEAAGVVIPENVKIIDVMQIFAGVCALRGEWDRKRNRPKWRSLVECAEFCGYNWQGEAHDALADARAAAFCYKKLAGGMRNG